MYSCQTVYHLPSKNARNVLSYISVGLFLLTFIKALVFLFLYLILICLIHNLFSPKKETTLTSFYSQTRNIYALHDRVAIATGSDLEINKIENN